jgi:hypothetical protein
MKKILLFALLVLAVLGGIWVFNQTQATPSESPQARNVPRPSNDSNVTHQTPENQPVGSTQKPSGKTIPPARESASGSVSDPTPPKSNDAELVQKNMALLQQVGMAVAELPEIKAGIQRVLALKGEFGTATTERKEEINKELKEIQDRHTEAYRNAFRDLGMAESIVQGIQITLPSQPSAAGTAQPAPPKSAEPVFQ